MCARNKALSLWWFAGREFLRLNPTADKEDRSRAELFGELLGADVVADVFLDGFRSRQCREGLAGVDLTFFHDRFDTRGPIDVRTEKGKSTQHWVEARVDRTSMESDTNGEVGW